MPEALCFADQVLVLSLIWAGFGSINNACGMRKLYFSKRWLSRDNMMKAITVFIRLFFFNLHTIRNVGTQKRNYWSRYLPTTLESTPYDTLWCLIIILLKWHQHKSCPYACKRPFKSQSLSWSGSSYAHLCLFWVEQQQIYKIYRTNLQWVVRAGTR